MIIFKQINNYNEILQFFFHKINYYLINIINQYSIMTTSVNKNVSTIIGPYRYTQSDLLGQGYESKVYKGVHIIKRYQVALKIIQLDRLDDGISRKLLQSEIKCLEAMRGTPHVINLLDVVKTDKYIYVFTELCKGDLGVKEGIKIDEREAWKYFKQLIKGYKSLYQKQIIHRDIKPENMFLKCEGQIKIGDFGFAVSKSEAKKQSNYNIGSPSYMAPQILHRNQYSCSSDIWAIGVSFFQLVTGKLPWDCQNQKQLKSHITRFNIGKTIDSAEISETSKNFLRQTLCFDPQSRITPQELFQYELFQQARLLKNPSFDKLSYSTVETCRKINSHRQIVERNVQADKLIQCILQPKLQKPRRNSFDNNQKVCKNNDRISLHMKPNSFQSEKTISAQEQKGIIFTKKHKTSMEAQNNQLEIDIDKFSEQSIDKVITAHLQLTITAFRFLESIEKEEFNQIWGTELNVFKVSLRNYIVKTIQKIEKLEKSDLLEGLAQKQQIKKYIESQYYERAYSLMRNYESLYEKNAEFSRYKSKARQQKSRAIANAGFSLTNRIKQIIKQGWSKDLLQKIQDVCILTETFLYISKNKYLSNEVILGSVKIRKSLLNIEKVMKRIQELQKSK